MSGNKCWLSPNETTLATEGWEFYDFTPHQGWRKLKNTAYQVGLPSWDNYKDPEWDEEGNFLIYDTTAQILFEGRLIESDSEEESKLIKLRGDISDEEWVITVKKIYTLRRMGDEIRFVGITTPEN